MINHWQKQHDLRMPLLHYRWLR